MAPSTPVDGPVDNQAVVARVVACKRCRRHTDTAGPLSARKLCADCGEAAVWGVAIQLAERCGPAFDHWRRRTILALLDLDTAPGTSLDLISDEQLRLLLSTPGERVQH